MTQTRNRPMSAKVQWFDEMKKSDFDFFAAQNGFTVEVVKNKRDGWNDSRSFFVTKDGTRTKVEEVSKGQSPRWNEMVDHVNGVKPAWCAGQAA